MTLVFSWRKRANLGLAIALVGLTGLVQSLIVQNAQATLGITSIYILTLVPIGVSIALSGVEMDLAEKIHRRFSAPERRNVKWKLHEGRGLRSLMRKLEISVFFSALLILAISSATYMLLVAAWNGTGIPYYARFVLADSASVLIAVLLEFVMQRII